MGLVWALDLESVVVRLWMGPLSLPAVRAEAVELRLPAVRAVVVVVDLPAVRAAVLGLPSSVELGLDDIWRVARQVFPPILPLVRLSRLLGMALTISWRSVALMVGGSSPGRSPLLLVRMALVGVVERTSAHGNATR